jgi:hypothetical protein
LTKVICKPSSVPTMPAEPDLAAQIALIDAELTLF